MELTRKFFSLGRIFFSLDFNNNCQWQMRAFQSSFWRNALKRKLNPRSKSGRPPNR